MAFKFRLQTVLDHRLHLEEKAMAEFGKKLQAQRDAEEQIKWLQGEHGKSRRELATREKGGLAAQEYIMANEYLTVLRLTATREAARLPMLKAATEQARLKLVEATRARKALEILRDSQKAEWEYQTRMREQKLLDEAAIGSFSRRRKQ